jgi:hypothetical protein
LDELSATALEPVTSCHGVPIIRDIQHVSEPVALVEIVFSPDLGSLAFILNVNGATDVS